MKEHEKEFKEGNNATESFLVYQDGNVEQTIIHQKDFCVRCNGCEGCSKRELCDDWKEKLGRLEGRYIRDAKSRNRGCVNSEVPYAEVISSDFDRPDFEIEDDYDDRDNYYGD